MSVAYIGTSGWTLPQCAKTHYAGFPRGEWLAAYAQHFDAVEMNNSFYQLPSEAMIARWVSMVPPGFLFMPKAWRAITHYHRLRDCADVLAKCLDRFAGFKEALGPVLFQLPASLHHDDAVFDAFLKLLPESLPCAFEFRHESWRLDPVKRRLRERGIATVQANLRGWTAPLEIEPHLAYIRLHGSTDWFRGGYDNVALGELAASLRRTRPQTACVFFNNTVRGDVAVDDAVRLSALLTAPPGV